ncbi:MAG: hypothetical protein HRU25_14600 [Psychrobium sp.]|nr:hypothetical protein [Psychrobium sp.]
MTNIILDISNNDLTINISVEERNDEVGDIAQALVIFKKKCIRARKT